MTRNDRLCYLEASRLVGPYGGLSDFALRSPDDRLLGKLDGAVIDTAERKLRYLVVECGPWFGRRRYLVPADAAPRVETEPLTLRVDVEPDDLPECEEFDGKLLRKLTDRDLAGVLSAA